MLKYSFNNFKCMFGQQKNGVQFGGSTILKYLGEPSSKTIEINSYKDYMKGYKVVNKNLKNNYFNINLGGDHSIAVSTIQPMLDKYKHNLLVVWIDAHADTNTFKSSITNNIHGMPVSALMGEMNHWYIVPNKRIKLRSDNLLYIGLRDPDPFEIDLINKRKIKVSSKMTYKTLDLIKKHPAKYIHISCDIDSMSPHYMPSTGTPVYNGLSVEEVKIIVEQSKSRLVGFDLVEFNPMIGTNKEVLKTLVNIKEILNTVMK